MKNVIIILGNGFSIDFLKQIKKEEEVDVSNLFHFGENVPWPVDNQPGFLSYKYCPNLWTLGARSFLNTNDSIALIEDIITCANILQKSNTKDTKDKIYIKAYKELEQYLMSLFIYYNKHTDSSDSKLKEKIKNWGWYKYFKYLDNNSDISNIYIITFNYDIWLEKILQILNIEFNITCFEKKKCKFQIFKPHGSISFQSNIRRDQYAFNINYSTDLIDNDINQFHIEYKNINPLNLINAIIPPAGDSNRLNFKWAECIRNEAKQIASQLNKNDELVLCGLSYWHVDRLEIDSILTNMTPDLSNVKIINPNPPKVINAVITTLFKNVIFYTHCKNLNNHESIK